MVKSAGLGLNLSSGASQLGRDVGGGELDIPGPPEPPGGERGHMTDSSPLAERQHGCHFLTEGAKNPVALGFLSEKWIL